MRFNVIERNPECYISSVRSNLENLLNAVIDRSENSFFQPLSEVRENENEYIVNIQLPGIKKENINIEIEDNMLSISAENKMEERQDSETLHYSNIAYGTFQKNIEFEKDIDVKNSKCELNDGILKITLKKMVEKKSNSTKFTIE